MKGSTERRLIGHRDPRGFHVGLNSLSHTHDGSKKLESILGFLKHLGSSVCSFSGAVKANLYLRLLLLPVVALVTACCALRETSPSSPASTFPSPTDTGVPVRPSLSPTVGPTVTSTADPQGTLQPAELATPHVVTLGPGELLTTLKGRVDADKTDRYLLRGDWTEAVEIEAEASKRMTLVFEDEDGIVLLKTTGHHTSWRGEPPTTETSLIEIRSRERAHYTITLALRPAAVEPSIEVVAPDGDEIWLEGSTQTMMWRSSGVEKVDVEVASGGKPLGHVALGVDAAEEEYAWDIPVGLISNFGVTESDAMRVRISDHDNPNLYAETDDPFTVRCPRIEFESGATSTTITGTLPAGRREYRYAFRGSAGQGLEIVVSPPRLRVDVLGVTEGSTWQIPAGEQNLSVPTLPATQEYLVTLMNTSSDEDQAWEYVLDISIQ